MRVKKYTESEKIGIAIGILAATTTLAMAPFYAYDAFSGIKLIFITASGALSGYYVVKNINQIKRKLGKFISILIVSILLYSLAIFLLSEMNKYQAFYGVAGRYTGLLTYLSLILILTASGVTSNYLIRKKILDSFIFCGSLNMIYSLIQFSGKDFVNWDSNADSQVIGFLGNPNFVSSFLALTSIAVFSRIIGSKNSIGLNFFYALIILGALIGLIGANSTQGFLVFLIGFTIVIYFYFRYRLKSKIPSRLLVLSSILVAVFGVLDIFQKVPWNPILYSETVSIRGDYWRAGWNIALDNSIIGVGFDGFLNHYRRHRDLVAATRQGSEVPVDAAHNVLLDYASNGGFMFMILNCVLLGIIFITGIKHIKNLERFDQNFVAIFAIWIGFTTQSIVSINQLGLVIWGWIFGGLILGAKYELINIDVISTNNQIHKRKKNELNSFNTRIIIAALTGSLVSMPAVLADHKFKLAIDSKKALDLYNSANSWPPITKKMLLVTAVLTQNKIYKEARLLSKRTLQINPDSFEGWVIYAQNPLVTESEMSEIKKQILRLDPNIAKLGGVDKYLIERITFDTRA
jgi:O-antigen ligase